MDWLKGLKVGDLVVIPGTPTRLEKIIEQTPQFWSTEREMFRKSDGKIYSSYIRVKEATPEIIAGFRTEKKRQVSRKLFLLAIDKLTESDLDAIIAIFERAGK